MRNASAVFVAVVLSTLVAGCVSGPPMFVGRTTIMERSSLPGGPIQKQTAAMQKRRLDTLAALATSQKVICNATSTLSSLGLRCSPEQIRAATTVEPVRDTNIIAIEVTLPDASEAKVAADVIAAEFKKAYYDINAAELTQHREFLQSQMESAQRKMVQARRALDAYERNHRDAGAADPALVKLQSGTNAAKDTYASTNKKLAQAVLEEKAARSITALVTIDPAFVRPAK